MKKYISYQGPGKSQLRFKGRQATDAKTKIIRCQNYLMKILNFFIKLLPQEITKSLKMSEKIDNLSKEKKNKIDINEASEIRTERAKI